MLRHVHRSPKLDDLISRLELPRYAAKGILVSLWHFAATQAQRGNVGRWTDQQIAAAIDWRDDPEALIAALVASHWLDRCQEHRLVVHDWGVHCDQSVRRSPLVRAQGFAQVSPIDERLTSDSLASDERLTGQSESESESEPESESVARNHVRNPAKKGRPRKERAKSTGVPVPVLPSAGDPLWERLATHSTIPEITAEEAHAWGELVWPGMLERGVKKPGLMLAAWWKRLKREELEDARRALANRRSVARQRQWKEEAEREGEPSEPELVIPVRSIGGAT